MIYQEQRPAPASSDRSGGAGAANERLSLGVWLDEFHGLRIAIKGHEGKWPVSTIKMAEQGSALRLEQANPGKSEG